MKKLIVSQLILILILTTSISPMFAKTKVEPPSIINSTVIVYTSTNLGSGFAMEIGKEKYIITCSHIVEDNNSVIVTPYLSQSSYMCKVLYLDKAKDVAILKYENTWKIPTLKLSNNTIKRLDTVYTCGMPSNMYFTVSKGIVANLNINVNMEGRRNMLVNVFDLNVGVGSSGGAILNDNSEVIGMVGGMSDDGFSFGIKVDDIISVILNYKNI